MKSLLIVFLFFIPILSSSQKGTTIYYVVNESGNETAKRITTDTSRWVVDDPQKSLEVMYKELERLNEKYQLALSILKLIGQNGAPVDMKRYNMAVTAFNSYPKNK